MFCAFNNDSCRSSLLTFLLTFLLTDDRILRIDKSFSQLGINNVCAILSKRRDTSLQIFDAEKRDMLSVVLCNIIFLSTMFYSRNCFSKKCQSITSLGYLNYFCKKKYHTPGDPNKKYTSSWGFRGNTGVCKTAKQTYFWIPNKKSDYL